MRSAGADPSRSTSNRLGWTGILLVGTLAFVAAILTGCSEAVEPYEPRTLTQDEMFFVVTLRNDIMEYAPTSILMGWNDEMLADMGQDTCADIDEVRAAEMTVAEHAEKVRAESSNDDALFNRVLVLNAAVDNLCFEHKSWLAGSSND